MTIYRTTGKQLVIEDRVKPLVFGQYAWMEDTEKAEAGSGIFVARRLGLSAKHVSKSYRKLAPGFDAKQRRAIPLQPQYERKKVESEFASIVYSFTDRPDDPVHWKVNTDWPSYDTDITTIVVEPRTPAAEKREPELRYLDWQLLPPRIGKMVYVYGFPGQRHRIKHNDHQSQVELWIQPARVVDHVYPMQAHALGEFPGFRLDREMGHGASGAAVVYDDRLVGIFSGPTLVASLWPLAIHMYLDIDEVEQPIADLFENGTINAVDWDEVKGRVERQPCDVALAGSSIESRCEKNHVTLLR